MSRKAGDESASEVGRLKYFVDVFLTDRRTLLINDQWELAM